MARQRKAFLSTYAPQIADGKSRCGTADVSMLFNLRLVKIYKNYHCFPYIVQGRTLFTFYIAVIVGFAIEKQKVSQYQLLQGGIDNKTLDSLKKGKNIPVLTLQKICTIAGCTPNDVVKF